MIQPSKAILIGLLLAGTSWAEPARKSYVQIEVASVRSTPKDGAEQVTQALLGDEVQILEERPEWYKVYVVSQYRTAKGYPGWVRKEAISRQGDLQGDSVLVAVPETLLREKPDPKARVVQRASLGARLIQQADKDVPGWLALSLPGRKEVVYAPAGQFNQPVEPASQGKPIVATAAQLKGTHYLWGGMSLKGIDCSGFTYTAYRVHGITIPRDADQQFQIGSPVKLADLQPGDLLFFGDSASEISHVGMYMGEDKFIHASGSLGGVTVTPIDSPKYTAIFQGARRILGSKKLTP